MGAFFTTPEKIEDRFDADLLIDVVKLFERKNWKTTGTGTFNLFCAMLEELSAPQRAMMIELSYEFVKLELAENQEAAQLAFYGIDPLLRKGCKRLFIMPLKRIRSYGEIKSCDTVFNFFRSSDFIADLKIKAPELAIVLASGIGTLRKSKLNADDMVVFVDDFLGSGQTAVDCISEIRQEFISLTLQQFIIVAIMAHKEGIKNLNNEKIKLSYHFDQGKGISDKFDGKNMSSRKDLMRQIEQSLNVPEGFRFGYGGSESLASLIRTPNNTFPIFWFNRKSKKGDRMAPFPRYN